MYSNFTCWLRVGTCCSFYSLFTKLKNLCLSLIKLTPDSDYFCSPPIFSYNLAVETLVSVTCFYILSFDASFSLILSPDRLDWQVLLLSSWLLATYCFGGYVSISCLSEIEQMFKGTISSLETLEFWLLSFPRSSLNFG